MSHIDIQQTLFGFLLLFWLYTTILLQDPSCGASSIPAHWQVVRLLLNAKVKIFCENFCGRKGPFVLGSSLSPRDYYGTMVGSNTLTIP